LLQVQSIATFHRQIPRPVFGGASHFGGAQSPMLTLWLFNIAMENGPFIDGLPGFTY